MGIFNRLVQLLTLLKNPFFSGYCTCRTVFKWGKLLYSDSSQRDLRSDIVILGKYSQKNFTKFCTRENKKIYIFLAIPSVPFMGINFFHQIAKNCTLTEIKKNAKITV